MQSRLDDVDLAILRQLEEDGRRPYRQIARAVGVSEGTVRARIRRLEASGVVRVLAFVDPSRLGTSVLALVLVRLETDHHDDIVAALTAMPEATYVSTLVGRADVYVQAICADNEALWSLVTRIRALRGVLETETMIEIGVHKFTYREAAASIADRQVPPVRRLDGPNRRKRGAASSP
ncbi:MAG TPA: Lrp/AsnC family transcriptional regulator [Gaiellales bacterium]|nr:Lrp/AsnC family transcriptional regulator [Gaiellales bacterium]